MKPSNSMSMERQDRLKRLSGEMALPFSDLSLFHQALTHSSWAGEFGGGDYERLEFFGDAVLKFVVSEYLFVQYPQMNEGDLTQVSSVLVSAKTLEAVGRSFHLDDYVLIGKGVPKAASIIARSMEAILGAAYIDCGFDHVRPFIIAHILSLAESVAADDIKENYKAQLQQWTQARGRGTPSYSVLKVEGPAHDPMFAVAVHVGNETIGEGSGRSKKIAEQAAAKVAFELLRASET